MQNFPNSPATLPPGFPSRGVNIVGSPYPPHLSDPQISPRTVEDYAAMQQHQPILPGHGQHLHLRGQQHHGQVPHIHGYGPRRGVVEIPQASTHSGSSSAYRKDSMDYYFSMSGRDRNRRGGYTFGYSNLDGHLPHQYRHVSGTSSGMMSPYPMDYSSSAASVGGGGSSAGAGSFSPSQQFTVAQNPSLQTVSGTELHQHQKYPSHQGLHQGHRAYSLGGNRIPSQFGHYPTLSVPTASPGMYNSPPQRYDSGGSGGIDAKMSNSPTQASSNASAGPAASNNSGPQENVGPSYPSASQPPYSPQSHPVAKHGSRRTPQQSLGTAYDAPLKMQHPPPSQSHLKNNQSSVSLSPAAPLHASQDISKSPMHSQNQQTRMNQNFSPISNPSPAPSVHSPSCSSSSSPLMGVSEGMSNSATMHSSLLNPRHSNARPQHAMAQLSPTPSSNSSISSCGSVGSTAINQNRVGVGPRAGHRDDGSSSLYQHEKLPHDPGFNSLNALTSQVANLPNTVQHMMLTDTVLSQKKNRDQMQLQQMTTNQQKSRNTSATVQSTSKEEREDVFESELEEVRKGTSEQSEHGRGGPKVGGSTESKLMNFYPAPPAKMQMDNCDSTLNKRTNKLSETILQTKEPDTQTSSSSSPVSVPPYVERSPNAPSCPPAPSLSSSSTSSPAHSAQSNCVTEPEHGNTEKPGLKEAKCFDVKDEEEMVKCEELCHQDELQRRKDVQTLARVKVEDSALSEQDRNKNDEKINTTEYLTSKHSNTQEQSNAGVGVIVSARYEGPKPTDVTSYGTLSQHGKLNYSDEKPTMNKFRDSTNHNGDGNIGMETCTPNYVSPKTEFDQTPNHCQPGSYKYNNLEVPFNACMGAKNKGRVGQGGALGSDRYQDYHPSQSNFGSASGKDVGVAGVMGRSGLGVGSRGHDSSQIQQIYPSLLQEVLQGYHLDRRYGRPDQAPASLHHPHPQNMSQQHYHTRLPYRLNDNLRPHGISQSAGGGTSIHSQMASGKPHNQGSNHEIGLALYHSAWDLEAQRLKGDHGILEKGALKMSPSRSGYVPAMDSSSATPPKHINLADYSLPHRKHPSLASPPSAVQQLLLQESGPLSGTTEPAGPTHASSSSGRRSVICDVSPSRRTTPEKERSQFGPPVSSVIQQPNSFPKSEPGCSKANIKDKREQELKGPSKLEPSDLSRRLADEGTIVSRQESGKSLITLMDMNSDLHRHGAAKEPLEPKSNAAFQSQHHIPANPLSSPPRCKPFPKSHIDGPPAGFPAYGYGDVSEGSKVNSHHTVPSHNPFSPLSHSGHITSSTSKLQTYPHHMPLQQTRGMDDRFDWSANSDRPKDISLSQQSTQNTEQKGRIQSPTIALPSQHHFGRQQSYPGSHYDLKVWESNSERESSGNQQLHSVVSPHKSTGPQLAPATAQKCPEPSIPQGTFEESAKNISTSAACGVSGVGNSVPQGPRPTKAGGSAETNPLMLRRRVRSFISPIPAKRQHQDSNKSGATFSPLASSEPKHLSDSDSGSTDIRPKVASPGRYLTPNTNSPPLGKSKVLPPRKGRGLKLEAIVQKITPNKKGNFSNNHADADFSDVSQYSTDLTDPEVGPPFTAVSSREGSCLPYLDEPNSIDDILPYRPEEAYSSDSHDLKPVVAGSVRTTLKNMPTDFDFGLGTTGSTGSGIGAGDKDEFTLLGPLPPPPPLPRPVQGSPPPSSSALSDIQQFTNTYQQLETRRGEQSAANLLRQKLQESSMGFDDYPGGDFYGSTSMHGRSPGNHLLSRQNDSARMASDSKSQDSLVPKGYFPSGKKKGRPVGSVNKQKRAQGQVPNATVQVPAPPATPPATPAVAPQTPANSSPAEEEPIALDPPEEKPSPTLDLAPPAEPPKLEVEAENSQHELDIKPTRHRQRKGKEGNEGAGSQGKQWRKRRDVAPKEDLEPLAEPIAPIGTTQDARKNVFSPYIHVENKITEIGAVCTIINAEGEKSKGGTKNGSFGVDAPSTVSLTSQTVRREKEVEKIPEKETQTGSVIPSGKSLPSSGYVLPGPVVCETGHTGRLLCCLCQKWANYKNLGDLYGPFYPAEYAAKFPKNQPQKTLSNPGASNQGSTPPSTSTDPAAPEAEVPCPPDVPSADCSSSLGEGSSSNPVPVMMDDHSHNTQISGTASDVPAHPPDLMSEEATGLGLGLTLEEAPVPTEAPDLEAELAQRRQQRAEEDVQQRPQHRKLTSHPRFKRRHKSGEDLPRTVPINSKASLPFQPPPPTLDSLGPLGQLAQLPLVPLDPKELWVHESCIVWTSGVYLVSGRLYGLQEALDGARETSCSQCEMPGSTLGCYSKGCTLRYHYLCAVEAECCLNEENFSVRCPKHKFSLNSRSVKPTSLIQEQSE